MFTENGKQKLTGISDAKKWVLVLQKIQGHADTSVKFWWESGMSTDLGHTGYLFQNE